MMTHCVDCGASTKGGKRCNSCAAKARWANPVTRKKQMDCRNSAVFKQKIAQTSREAYARGDYAILHDPVVKRKRAEGIKAAHARGDYDSSGMRRMLSDAQKRRWAVPGARKRQSELAIAQWADSNRKERLSNTAKKNWAKAAHRNKHLIAAADPNVRKKQSDGMKAAHARGCYDAAFDEARIKGLSEAVKQQWGDPEYRKKMIGARACPVYRENISTKLKAAHARGCYDGVYHSPSKLELSVLAALEERGLKCKGQYRPEGCSYIYDIYLVDHKTLIEVDGTYWHSDEHRPGVVAHDAKKDDWASEHDYGIIRIPEEVINADGLRHISEQVITMLAV